MAKYSKEFRDVLLEAAIDFISYTNVEEIATVIYTDETKEVINKKMNIKNREDFKDYISRALKKPMKQAEMAMDIIVSSVMGTLLRKDKNELVSFVQKYYDPKFTGDI